MVRFARGKSLAKVTGGLQVERPPLRCTRFGVEESTGSGEGSVCGTSSKIGRRTCHVGWTASIVARFLKKRKEQLRGKKVILLEGRSDFREISGSETDLLEVRSFLKLQGE